MTTRLWWFVPIVLLAAACGSDGISTDDLDQASQAWAENEPRAFHWRADGFVDGLGVDIDLVIVDGAVESESGSGLGGDFAPDGLFNQIREALDTGVSVSGGFNDDVGYPERVVIGGRVDLTTRDFIPIARPHGCTSEPGSTTDLSAEPAAWLLYGDYHRWTDSAGCDVRIDVISQIMGPAHCGWESATFITTGDPIGAVHSTSAGPADGSRTYIWDPDGVVGYIDGIERDVSVPIEELPVTVVDTGFRDSGAELWLDDADDTTLYRVQDGLADRFVVDEPRRILCE